MAKKTISELSAAIQNYAAKTEPLSIDPILDGGIKQDILDTLNNKAKNTAKLKLAAAPSREIPLSGTGNNGEYYFYTRSGGILYKKTAGVWNTEIKDNTIEMYFDDVDGTRYYYALSDNLSTAIQTHFINFANPTGTAILTTPQTLTEEEKTQAQINIDAASKSYIDNAIANIKNSGAVGNIGAGSVMPWFGTAASVPQDWMVIPNEETFLLKSEYPDLYDALGGENNVFGVTDTLFAIPFLEGGSSIVHTGENFTLGQKGGEENHILDITEMPEHSHIINLDTATGVETTGINATNANTLVGGSVQTENSGGGLAHNNMPPYIAANYIIKTKNSLNFNGSYDAEHIASPTTGNLTLKIATETILETALTDANVFTVVLPTPTTRVNESILIFKVGATLPAITLPVGITFPKALTYEANKTHTIVFEQVTFNGTDYEIFGSYEIR